MNQFSRTAKSAADEFEMMGDEDLYIESMKLKNNKSNEKKSKDKKANDKKSKDKKAKDKKSKDKGKTSDKRTNGELSDDDIECILHENNENSKDAFDRAFENCNLTKQVKTDSKLNAGDKRTIAVKPKENRLDNSIVECSLDDRSNDDSIDKRTTSGNEKRPIDDATSVEDESMCVESMVNTDPTTRSITESSNNNESLNADEESTDANTSVPESNVESNEVDEDDDEMLIENDTIQNDKVENDTKSPKKTKSTKDKQTPTNDESNRISRPKRDLPKSSSSKNDLPVETTPMSRRRKCTQVNDPLKWIKNPVKTPKIGLKLGLSRHSSSKLDVFNSSGSNLDTSSTTNNPIGIRVGLSRNVPKRNTLHPELYKSDK